MIHIPDSISERMRFYVGDKKIISNEPVEVFNTSRLNFLADLSRELLADRRTKSLPDIVSFAYWCRFAALKRQAEKYSGDNRFRMGLGLSFHICPSNVPINFAFSMAFGLLSGNSCVLRLPSTDSATVDILIDAISVVITKGNFESLARALKLVRYDHDDEVNLFWLSVADARIIWGGDATISKMRSYPSRPRSREIAFSDRYSLCALNPEALLALDNESFSLFCRDFYTDIYTMDQAACTSPQLLAWIGPDDVAERAKLRLWSELVLYAESKYKPRPVQVMDKFVALCCNILNNSQIKNIYLHGNLLYRIDLSAVGDFQDRVRGYYGTVHEVVLPNIISLASIISDRYQTLAVFGIDKGEIKELISTHRLRGVDRVVSVGRTLDIDVVWDGYDIIGGLSRIVSL